MADSPEVVLDDAIKLGARLVGRHSERENDAPAAVVEALVLLMWRQARAVRTLVADGLSWEAGSLIRTMLEIAFTIAWFLEPDDASEPDQHVIGSELEERVNRWVAASLGHEYEIAVETEALPRERIDRIAELLLERRDRIERGREFRFELERERRQDELADWELALHHLKQSLAARPTYGPLLGPKIHDADRRVTELRKRLDQLDLPPMYEISPIDWLPQFSRRATALDRGLYAIYRFESLRTHPTYLGYRAATEPQADGSVKLREPENVEELVDARHVAAVAMVHGFSQVDRLEDAYAERSVFGDDRLRLIERLARL